VGLFNRKPKNPAYIPGPHLRALREYGEHLAGQPTNYRSFDVDLDMLDFMQQDPETYIEMLAAHIGPKGPDSGAYCLGVAESVSVWKIEVSTPAWDRIVDGATEYLRALRLSYNQARPYMKARWTESHTPDEW
jgi:hypothetical protein